MKSGYDIGDLVVPGVDWGIDGVDYGIGLVIDMYTDEFDPHQYYCVQWRHEFQWWNEGELLPYR